MNDVIDNIMTFINENTTILIIICIFLIFVLVVYLIENAIKSSKINKNIEKDKEEIAKKVEEIKKEEKEEKEENIFENAVVPDSPKVEEIFNEPLVDKIDESESVVNIDDIIPSEPVVPEDKSVDVIFKNDKKLSEILFGEIEKQPEGKLDDSITKKEDDNIKKLEDSADELDKILKKLDDYNVQEKNDDDNYSNIF